MTRRTWLGIALTLAAAACSGTPTGIPDGTAAATTAEPTMAPATPTPEPLPTALTPTATTIDGVKATVLRLGKDAGPIDVAVAFGSVWVANHHMDEVARLDPVTMAVEARIESGSGPAWFAITDDDIWVSDQNGRGMSRIDPATNTGEPRVAGQYPPCAAPTLAMGAIWQPACDAHQLMRIDPVTKQTRDYDWGDHLGIVAADDVLFASGRLGMARYDPATETFEELGGLPGAFSLEFDGETIWAANDGRTVRVRPSDGKELTSWPTGGGVAFRDGHAWLLTHSTLEEIDLATNATLRTVHFQAMPYGVAASDGAIWLTFFDSNSIVRLDL